MGCWGSFGLGTGGWGWGGVYLQDAYSLEPSEGSLGDVADGVVAQTESVEIPQHSQTAFIQTSQVVVRQIPGERNRARGRQKRGRRQTQRRREKERGKKKGEEREMFCVRSGRRWQVGKTLRQLATSLHLNFMADSMSICHSVMCFSIVPFSSPQDVNTEWT